LLDFQIGLFGYHPPAGGFGLLLLSTAKLGLLAKVILYTNFLTIY